MIGMLAGNSSTADAYSWYFGQDAANYAVTYATSYNSSYHEFSSDCTNFASQCVLAGGKSMEGFNRPVFNGTIESSSSKWYYYSQNGSPHYYACSTPWVRCGGSNAFYHMQVTLLQRLTEEQLVHGVPV